jgi:glycosyltransferase involved in cell wall biosynthesis
MNESDAKFLANLGVDRKRIQVTYGAIDRKVFFPLERYSPNRNVLVTGDAKGRKNPEKIIETINANPDMFFDICGRYWEEQLLQKRVLSANYKIHEFDIEKTAKLMRDSSVFLTLSLMEGGPFPILEALSSGTPVVSTPVGWVPEIVNDRRGVVVSQNSSIAEVSAALEKCFKLKADSWHVDLLDGKYTWGELALKLYEPSYFVDRDPI